MCLKNILIAIKFCGGLNRDEAMNIDMDPNHASLRREEEENDFNK